MGKIAIAHEFFSNELKHTEAKLRIKDELSSYCVVTEPPKTTFGKVAQFALENSAPRTQDSRAFPRAWQVRQTYTGKLYGALGSHFNPAATHHVFGTCAPYATQASRTTCASPSS